MASTASGGLKATTHEGSKEGCDEDASTPSTLPSGNRSFFRRFDRADSKQESFGGKEKEEAALEVALTAAEKEVSPKAKVERTRPPSYLEHASWWNILTFGWMNPVIKEGNKRLLTDMDMPALARRDQARHLKELVQSHWESEMKLHPDKPQLWLAMIKAFFPIQLPMYLPFAIVTTCKIVQAHVGIKGLIHVLDRGGPAREGYVYAGVIVFTGWIMLMLHHQVQFMGWRLGLAIRTSLECAIFRKILRMPLSSFSSQGAEGKEGDEVVPGKEEDVDAYKKTITMATVLNLATTDVERFQPVATTSHYLVLAPFEILAIMWCGVHETGLPFLIGMLALLLLIPIQGRVAKVLQDYGKRASQLTDQRVRLTKQAIQGARTIKMSGWEVLLEKRIKEARAVEMRVLIAAGLVRGIHEGIYFFSPVLVGAVTFLTDWGLGSQLDAGRVFSTLTLFNILQWDVVNFGGKAMQSLGEVWVSLGRLEHLLRMPELPSYRLEASTTPPSNSFQAPSPPMPTSSPPPASVHVNGLSFNWSGPASKSRPTLRHISFDAPVGKILGLAGPVGSGKSTLLLALLGELGEYDPKVVNIGRGCLAYASQEPWILTGSVRENILMGRPYDHAKYLAVLRAACLKPDLLQWDHADYTVIGDRGVNMSGGQRARIGLARMAYGAASLYLIDDALSALDPKVGRRVFSRLICGLLKGSTRILATHQLQYLLEEEEVPKVLFINRGKVRGQGTMQELLAQGFFPDANLDVELLPRHGDDDHRDRSVSGLVKRKEEEETVESPTSVAVVKKSKGPRNLPPFMPTRTMSTFSANDGDTSDRDSSGVVEANDGPVLLSTKPTSLTGRIFQGILSLRTPHRSGSDQSDSSRGRSSSRDTAVEMGSKKRGASIQSQALLSDTSVTRTRRTTSALKVVMPNLEFSQDGGMQDILSDEDSDASESGKDEFNFHHQHARPSSPSNLRTSGDSRDRLLSQVLSIKEEEEESSEDEEEDNDGERLLGPVIASTAAESALAVTAGDQEGNKESESVDGEGNGKDGTEEEAHNVEEEQSKREAAERDSIIAREGQKAGQLGAGTYGAYMKGMGGVSVGIAVLTLIAAGQVAAILSNLFLSYWVRLPFEKQRKFHFVAIYVILVGSVGVLSVARAMVSFDRMLRASQSLHDDMIHAVLRAPISFFDTNPTGRIINRTTKDVLMCDVLLPVTMFSFVQTMLICLGTIGVVVSVNPWLLIVLVPLAVTFIPLRRQFLNTSREARRLEATARSPVYAYFSEAMDGLPTIRSLVAGTLFQDEFYRRLDNFSRPYFIFFSAGRHLGFRLDSLCWLMMTATTFSSLATVSAVKGMSGVSEWLVGMSLMYVLQLAAIFQWATRQSSDVENQIVSVERIMEYCQLPPEAALDSTPGRAPRSTWPETGAIVATNLQASYRPGLPLVLKGMSFSIPGGTRVGIVGRTGCGKSTLIQALFRLMEPSGGSLCIDGIDTSTLGLHDLRCRLSVIPQNPFLFSGTLRENMDPLGMNDDAKIWSALRAVQMEDQIQVMGVDFGMIGSSFETPLGKHKGTPSSRRSRVASFAISHDARADSALQGFKGMDLGGPGLDMHVTENGGNFSLGERQLLCLARAILSSTRILVCDEATANVDVETDQKIQRAIRSRFGSATVLMIAHRLNTIIDSDILLVLQAGEVLEMGHPHELLNTPKGLPESKGGFLSMVMETGPDTAASLKEMARAAWEEKRTRGQEPKDDSL